jgi:hypothetical protein
MAEAVELPIDRITMLDWRTRATESLPLFVGFACGVWVVAASSFILFSDLSPDATFWGVVGHQSRALVAFFVGSLLGAARRTSLPVLVRLATGLALAPVLWIISIGVWRLLWRLHDRAGLPHVVRIGEAWTNGLIPLVAGALATLLLYRERSGRSAH